MIALQLPWHWNMSPSGFTIGRAVVAFVLSVAGVCAGSRVSSADPRDLALAQATEASDSSTDRFLVDNAVIVATIRPAEFARNKQLAPLWEAVQRIGSVQKTLGVDLDQIEQATGFLRAREVVPGRSSPEPVGVVLVLKDQASRQALLSTLFPDVTPETVADLAVFSRTDASPACYTLVEPHTVILATDKENLQDIVSAGKDGSPRPDWTSDWNRIASSSLGVLIDTSAIRASLDAELQRAPAETASLLSLFAPLWQNARLMTLRLNLDQAFELEWDLVGDNVNDAGRLKQVLESLVTVVRSGLEQVRGQLDEIPGEQGQSVRQLANVAESLLQKLRIRQQESHASLSVALPVDVVATLATALLPAVDATRQAALRTQSQNNLKQIALAMHNYHDTYGHFPPAVLESDDGETTHSWRVAILPFLGAADLYNDYNRNEPWDSENNRKVLARMPTIFRSPTEDATSTDSCYYALLGDETVFADDRAMSLRQITDGTSNTLMIVEARRDIPWTRPDDIPYTSDDPLPKLGGFFADGWNGVFCDGAVRFISSMIDEAVLRALITPDGGEAVNF